MFECRKAGGWAVVAHNESAKGGAVRTTTDSRSK